MAKLKRTTTIKLCPGCNRYLPYEYFGLSGATADGVAEYCKQCTFERSNNVYWNEKLKCWLPKEKRL